MPKVVVLVGLYKASKYLEAKIKNLQQQTLQDIQVIFLNCQNLERERDIYEAALVDPRYEEIIFDEYQCLYNTWNVGIKYSQSTYICNSNVDDMWHPDYLKELTEFLDKSDYSIMSSKILSTIIPNQWDHSKWEYSGIYPMHTYPKSTAGPCPVWKRELHNKYGYFGEYSVIGDAKIWEKWYKNGEKFGLIDKPYTLYLVNPTSLERRRDPETNLLLRELDVINDKNNNNKEN